LAETVAVIRDLAIIILTILNIVLISILVFIAIQVWRLVRYVRRELPTLAGTARQALTTVEGTTDFLGTAVAKPAIRAISLTVAARRFLRVLALDRRRPEVKQ
jgi:hypothetical protein